MWESYCRWTSSNKYLVNYPLLNDPLPKEEITESYVPKSLEAFNKLLENVPNLTCKMMIKIHQMIIACIKTFHPIVLAYIPFTKFLEGHNGLSWNLIYTQPKPINYGDI